MRNFLPTAYGIKIIINYKMIDNYSNGMNSERRGASQGMHEPHQTPFRAHNVKHQNAEGLSLINTNCIKRTAAASIYTLNAMASSTHNPFPLWFLIVRLHQHAVLCAHVALEKGCCWCMRVVPNLIYEVEKWAGRDEISYHWIYNLQSNLILLWHRIEY